MNILQSKKIIYFLATLTPILMSGYCGLPDYGTAHTTNEFTYLTKPAYIDTSVNAVYISGRFSHTMRPLYANDKIYFGELSLHRSHTWKQANLSYGVFGYGGSYKVQHIEEYKGNKYFGGAGMTGEFNFNIPFKKVDWRIAGARITWFYENGRYASFRQMAERDSLIENINPDKTQVNISGFTEVLVKLDKVSFGFYGAMGKTLGNGEDAITASGAAFLTYKRMTYFMQCAIGEWQGSSISAGIAYQIPQKRQRKQLRKSKTE